ncbi:MAG TPA: DUF998 domain-containing protein [Candidatus Dormibacteraeota bacterium]|nr:DUF998 domain-containing protein [Candidatus Dormibacteraeota bacterium]
MRTICRAVGMLAPPAAAVIVLVAGLLTPGYDPMTRTVSRLAAPGMPAAFEVDLAIALAGIACLALGIQIEVARAALLAAAGGFLVAAVVHLDPASSAATWSHRAASAVAVLGLTAAPLAMWRVYGRVLLALGTAELAMLAVAAVLLAAPFNEWGAWERVILLLGLTSLVVMARRMPSTDDPAKPRAAIQSSAGT